MSIAADVLAGNRLALSRLLTQVENDTPEGRQALNTLFAHTGQAHLIGITGAPGTGKSSLANQLARHYRQSTLRVAVVAVDPSSPFSGGAVLGDRIRMRELSGDPGVFIRSMASRGSLGGLAQSTAGVVQVFDAAGFDIILIETVGAGQAEVDIARLAHTTLVVEAPGLGDDIQAIKAGILEIADILVINKADRLGVEQTERALKNMLRLAHPIPHVFLHHGKLERVTAAQSPIEATQPAIWIPPVQRTIATQDEGIQQLAAAIAKHKQYLLDSGDWQHRDRARLQAEFESRIQTALVNRWRAAVNDSQFEQTLTQLISRQISPEQAVKKLLNGNAS